MEGMAIFKIGGWVGLVLSESPAVAPKRAPHERAGRAKPRPQGDRKRFQAVHANPAPSQGAKVMRAGAGER
jgi:hypothetical protein